jgi:hypothetical protein
LPFESPQDIRYVSLILNDSCFSDNNAVRMAGEDQGLGKQWSFILILPSISTILPHRPICVAEHLAPFLPSHIASPTKGSQSINAVSAAPFSSASIALISWAYIKMLGGRGLSDASKLALLNANYMASRLSAHYNLRYKNGNDRVAHELLIDLAEFEKSAGLKVIDFAKRLQVRTETYRIFICYLRATYRITDSILRHVHGQFPPAC